MFRSRSSVSYRMGKSRAGKKLKKYTRLLFSVGAVLLAVILTVLWGITLGEKAQESALRRAARREEEKALAANTPAWLPVRPDPIQAAYLGRVTSLDAATATAVTLLEDGAKALSVPLYEDRTPRYQSEIAQAMGKQQPGATDVTLSRLFAAILTEEGYIAATFTCSWQQESSPALRRAWRTYEAALVAEIAESGADEVLLLGLTVDSDTVDEVALFLREIRENCPDAVIGMAVNTAFMADDNHVERTRTLLTWADHVALDLSDYNSHTVYRTDEDGTTTRRVASLTDTLEMLSPAIACYRMRLLLPMSMYEKLEVIETLGYGDWQIIK